MQQTTDFVFKRRQRHHTELRTPRQAPPLADADLRSFSRATPHPPRLLPIREHSLTLSPPLPHRACACPPRSKQHYIQRIVFSSWLRA